MTPETVTNLPKERNDAAYSAGFSVSELAERKYISNRLLAVLLACGAVALIWSLCFVKPPEGPGTMQSYPDKQEVWR